MKNASQQQKIDLPPQYVESKTGLSRIDGLPIADEEIPFLIQRGYEKALKTMTESCNPKFHRTNIELIVLHNSNCKPNYENHENNKFDKFNFS